MKRIAVISKVLKSVGYDKATGILEVEFKNGGLYEYSDVSPEEYAALMLATSKGQYFGEQIRDRYRYRRVR